MAEVSSFIYQSGVLSGGKFAGIVGKEITTPLRLHIFDGYFGMPTRVLDQN